MIKATVKGKLSFPDFGVDITELLMEAATKEIMPDIGARINKSVDISDRRYPQLAESTIKIKMKKGQWPQPLVATGQLRSSMHAAPLGKSKVMIAPVGNRRDGLLNNELADILQNQGVRTKKGKRYFEFFGISRVAEERVIQRVKKRIQELIDNARPKNI